MRKVSLLCVLVFVGFTIHCQKGTPNYDAELAASLGADEYGLKSYVFVILKTGFNENVNRDTRNDAFKGHMRNISRLVKDDKLVIAGPFGQNTLT
ncbi:MAG: hypothetical protein ACI9DJ_002476 [Algoriphagus sp.]|jgi:hypothetical protein